MVQTQLQYKTPHRSCKIWPDIPWILVFLGGCYGKPEINGLVFERKDMPINSILIWVRDLASDFNEVFLKSKLRKECRAEHLGF